MKFKNLFMILVTLVISISLINTINASEITPNQDNKTDITSEINLENYTIDDVEELYGDGDETTKQFIVLTPKQVKELKANYSVSRVDTGYNYSYFNNWFTSGSFDMYMVNNSYVFCIQPTISASDSATEQSQSQSIYSSFSIATQTYIAQTISIGMDLYHQTDNWDYIPAAQLLIWDYLGDNESSVVGQVSGWDITKQSNFKDEVSIIKGQLNTFTTVPSFMGKLSEQGHTLEWNSSTEKFEITLTDTNGVWDSRYAKYGTFGKYTFTNPTGADNVKITTTSMNQSYYDMTFTFTPYNSGVKIFYNAIQDLIRVGAEPINGYLKLRTTSNEGGFELLKTDSETDKELAGAEFRLYTDENNDDIINGNDSSVGTYITNSSGKIEVSGIIPGNYIIREVKAPTGYVLNSRERNITIFANATNVAFVTNPIKNVPIKGGFELTKTGEIFNSTDVEYLEGVEFTLTKTGDSNFKKIYTTDSSGKIITGGSELEYGTYTITETKTDTKYVMDYAETFEISANSEIVSLNNGRPILNKLFTSQGALTKVGQTNLQLSANDDDSLQVDGDITIALENAEFDVVDENGIVVETIVSDEYGIVTTSPLPEGTYQIIETKAPEGYVLDDTPTEFTVSNNGNATGLTEDLEEFANDVVTNQIEITKADIATGAEIPGATLQIINSNGVVIEEWISTDETHVTTINFGDYKICEQLAPEGYLLKAECVDFSVSKNGITQKFKIENKVIENQIEITKTDATTGEELPGATLRIIDENGKVIEQWVSTNKEHKFTVKYGDYKICEQFAPRGYKKTDECINFSVSEDGVTQKFKLENELSKLSDTGIIDRRLYSAILYLSLTMIGLKIYVAKGIKTN